MKYRSDIDGLRAVAVVAVVFFHFGVTEFPGGFAGVDVFFVISGFLITSLLSEDIDRERFSLLKFYERRARRIFPALFAVIACTTVVAFLWFLPFQIYEMGQSVLATIFFASNILYYLKYGYFGTRAVENPLLHTWSLAVEEQFYIVFPLMLWLVSRYFRRYRTSFIFAVGLISFIYSIYLVEESPEAAFYMATSRAWELAMGALLALDAFPALPNRALREGLSVVGVGLLLVAFLTLNGTTPFPGFAALLPCGGTALIVYAGRNNDTFVSRLLSLQPVVWMGLISYSLYLWHWPLFVFYQQLTKDYPVLLEFREKLVLLIVGIGLAHLSWRYIEQPFRSKNIFNAKRIFRLSVGALVSLAVVGVGLVATDGAAERFPAEVTRSASFIGYDPTEPMRVGSCFAGFDQLDRTRCLELDPSKPNYIIVGDSFGAHLWYGLHEVFPEINFLQATDSACNPLIGQPGRSRCTQLMNYIFTDWLQTHKVDVLVLSERWKAENIKPLLETIKTVKTYVPRVVVVGSIAEYRTALPELLAKSLVRHDPSAVTKARDNERVAKLDLEMEALLTKEGVRYLSPFRTLCPNVECVVTDEQNNPLQFDTWHLTMQGSVFVAKHWRDKKLLP